MGVLKTRAVMAQMAEAETGIEVSVPGFSRLLSFSEAAGVGNEFDAVERAFAVDVPVLLQVVERSRVVAGLGALHPFGVAVVHHLSRHGAFRDREGGLVFIDHVHRPSDLAFLGFLVRSPSRTNRNAY